MACDNLFDPAKRLVLQSHQGNEYFFASLSSAVGGITGGELEPPLG
jgi:hypothetical protein